MCGLGWEPENFNQPLPGLQGNSSGAPEASLSPPDLVTGLGLAGLSLACFSKATFYFYSQNKDKARP